MTVISEGGFVWASLAKPPDKTWGWSQGVWLPLGVGKKWHLKEMAEKYQNVQETQTVTSTSSNRQGGALQSGPSGFESWLGPLWPQDLGHLLTLSGVPAEDNHAYSPGWRKREGASVGAERQGT